MNLGSMVEFKKIPVFVCVVFILLVAGQAFSRALPSHKDPSQWTPQDVQRILTDSPWAKQTSARFPEPTEQDESRGSAQADPDTAGVGSRSGMPLPGGKIGRWDGGVGRDPGAPPTLPVTIRWDSAFPVREALVRAGIADETLARSAKDYIVTVRGLWPGEAATSTDSSNNDSWNIYPPEAPTEHEKPRTAGLGHMRDSLLSSARLLLKGQRTLAPEDMTLDPKTGALHFFFPRTTPITLNDKEVTFSVQFGPMQVTEKFRLKDMVQDHVLQL